ncbi:MAG: hydrolase, partial [Clostridia bacterium]|nr:hydrolase [Clostridia bacterium]
MVYFIADTHFGHKNILRICGRPFETIEEMNETLIRNWNERVRGSDTVYIVGDMFFRCLDPEPILKR